MADAVRATPLAVPRQSMLAAVSVTESETINGTRWGFGVTWRSEFPTDVAGDATGARSIEWCVASAQLTKTGAFDLEEAYPFQVYARDSCGVMDNADMIDPRDRTARARRLLDATKSYQIAREFWMGAISAAKGLSNTWLKKATATSVGGAGTSPRDALALLDEAIADNLMNGRGMIHARPRVRDRWVQEMAIRREGNLWLTPQDNIVVADAGYDGSGPSAGEWAFATTNVEVYLGRVRVNTPEEGFSRDVNDIEVYAQQDAIVLHEPHLVWHSSLIDLSK